MGMLLTWPVLVFFLSTLFSPSIAGDTLTPSKPLADGETLVSAGGDFVLGFFTPPGSVHRYVGIWYNKVSIQTVVWVANRRAPITGTTGKLVFAANGSLIITAGDSNVVWSVMISGMASPVAQLLDTGNFIVREADRSNGFAWQSFDHPADTLLPGMKLGWNLTSGLNINLTAWTSTSDPAPGPYTMAMDPQGDPQIFIWAGSSWTWRTGPWNGLWFSGIPEMQTDSMFTFSIVANQEEVSYAFHVKDQNIISRLIVKQSGSTQRLVWVNQPKMWNVFWFAPKDQCEISPCGPNGVCNANGASLCSCLQGFTPKSPSNWALRDGSDGCLRKTKLDCVNRTDGFVTLGGAKLPDTSTAMVDQTISLEQCKAKCLSNCSCTAYAASNINGTESGCVIWIGELTDLRVYRNSGQDLYVRLAAADVGSTSNKSHKGGLAAVAIVLGVVVPGTAILAWIGCYMWKRKKRRRRGIFSDSQSSESKGKEFELPLFDMSSIISATDNFSIENKLGEGGFGPVYKGKLRDEQEIAIKRLSKNSVQGLVEFRNEMMLIAKLQHRNLVRLLGCCIQGEERMLIYEYMPNKSLDGFIFDKIKGALLDWRKRMSIISEIARGLLYLHRDSRLKIIHRDLKTSNILLDEEMNPKISDFGTARIFKGDQAHESTKRVIGTYGYMSPEYVMDGIFSVKSDVFSFGVIVLEILSGKKNRVLDEAEPHINLLGHAWRLWNEGKCLELLDSTLNHSIPVTEIMRCTQVGLLCVQGRKEDRPTMQSVVLMLSTDTMVLPQPKKPGFCMEKDDWSSNRQDLCASGGITITVIEGR